jgi:S-adenosylmethionine hydrolase
VVWVDRFGNVKTSVVVDEALAAALPLDSRAELSTEQGHAAPVTLRAVRTFADLSDGELGALADADGHLAIVAPQHSAALQLDVGVGDLVELWW